MGDCSQEGRRGKDAGEGRCTCLGRWDAFSEALVVYIDLLHRAFVRQTHSPPMRFETWTIIPRSRRSYYMDQILGGNLLVAVHTAASGQLSDCLRMGVEGMYLVAFSFQCHLELSGCRTTEPEAEVVVAVIAVNLIADSLLTTLAASLVVKQGNNTLYHLVTSQSCQYQLTTSAIPSRYCIHAFVNLASQYHQQICTLFRTSRLRR